MEDDRLARFFALLQNRWLWPLPAIGTSALILLFSSRVWVNKLPSRRGTPSSVAVSHLYLAGIALAVYAVVLLFGRGLIGGGGSWRMRAPTEAEGCALTLLQLMILALVYVSTFNLVQRYVFN